MLSTTGQALLAKVACTPRSVQVEPCLEDVVEDMGRYVADVPRAARGQSRLGRRQRRLRVRERGPGFLDVEPDGRLLEGARLRELGLQGTQLGQQRVALDSRLVDRHD